MYNADHAIIPDSVMTQYDFTKYRIIAGIEGNRKAIMRRILFLDDEPDRAMAEKYLTLLQQSVRIRFVGRDVRVVLACVVLAHMALTARIL